MQVFVVIVVAVVFVVYYDVFVVILQVVCDEGFVVDFVGFLIYFLCVQFSLIYVLFFYVWDVLLGFQVAVGVVEGNVLVFEGGVGGQGVVYEDVVGVFDLC